MAPAPTGPLPCGWPLPNGWFIKIMMLMLMLMKMTMMIFPRGWPLPNGWLIKMSCFPLFDGCFSKVLIDLTTFIHIAI